MPHGCIDDIGQLIMSDNCYRTHRFPSLPGGYPALLGIREPMRYSPPVKFRPLFLLVLAGVAMLSMQMTGLHLHASEPGSNTGLHGSHVHDVDSDGHDHRADVDVSLIDFGIVWSKIMPVLLAVFVTLPAIVWILHALWPPPAPLMPLRRRSRWRPPLRAPPLSP